MPPEPGGVLQGRVAVVTGAGQGLGRAIALLFAAEGASVGVVDINGEGARATAAEIRELGARVAGAAADAGDEDQVSGAVERAVSELGAVEILVNNAGIFTMADVVDMPAEQWDQMIRADLRSVFLFTRAVLPSMIDRRYGRVINVASQLAYRGGAGAAHYAAAKAGVLAFTRSVAREVASHNVLVNAIAPGPIATANFQGQPPEYQAEILAGVPLGRAARPEEIARTALLLASEAGSYYVGSTLNVNGGDVML